jgi:hypothetical protein
MESRSHEALSGMISNSEPAQLSAWLQTSLAEPTRTMGKAYMRWGKARAYGDAESFK